MYKSFIRPVLFMLPPERVHTLVVRTLKFFHHLGLTALLRSINKRHAYLTSGKEVFGLKFRNPVGLAAGFDKDAELIDIMDGLGFGFLEIGTLTPRPQPGNPKPRLFRLIEDKALVNRMGFNNEGVQAAIPRLKKRKSKLIIGGNIGKNKNTPNEDAAGDYLECLNALYDHVDYFVVNISSPNTPNLRELQSSEPLRELLQLLKKEIAGKKQYKPLLLKIAPDLTEEELLDIVHICNEVRIDGVVATNTTISREGLKTAPHRVTAFGSGGLSGLPLAARSTEVIRTLRKHLNRDMPIIGVGGIMSVQDAMDKMEAGATLLQLYTGFIYEGPGIVKKINRAIAGMDPGQG